MAGLLRTWSGKQAPISKEEGEVNIIDLVILGGRVGRFGNNGDPEWKLLHHSVLCALIALRLGYGSEVAVYALLHDKHEVYFGADLPSPIKHVLEALSGAEPGKGPVKQLERTIDGRINEHLGIKAPDAATRKKVKQCDRIAGVIESLLFGPVNCDLAEVLPEEERADMIALCEKVIPGFNNMVRRLLRGV